MSDIWSNLRIVGIPLFWTLFGAVIAEPVNIGIKSVEGIIWDSESRLAEGKRLREQAINQNSTTLHRSANIIFDEAAKLGSAEALAYRGQAYCYEGWDEVYDPGKGLAMIRSAYKQNSRISPDLITDPHFCPRNLR